MKNLSKNISPKVSIVLPVYNSKRYLKDCLESIINQTYKNTEIIIVDDASTDGSYKILQDYARKNRKIKLFRNKKNQGVSITVKRAIDEASGEYIARMDADDISIPTRIEKQVEYLMSHPKTVAVGGQCYVIDSNNKIIGTKTFPAQFEEIYKYIFYFIPVQQPTLMIARNRLPKNFVYYVDGMNTAEEVELFFKLFTYGKVENLNDAVLLYRMHDKNTSLLNVKETFLLTLIARIKAVFKYSYRPTLKGAIYTAVQTGVVLLLPQKIIISLYRFTRNTPFVAKPYYFDFGSQFLKPYVLQK